MQLDSKQLAQLKGIIDAFEEKNGLLGEIREVTTNSCTNCYSNGGCYGTCRGICATTAVS